jgi:hypothetical protein
MSLKDRLEALRAEIHRIKAPLGDKSDTTEPLRQILNIAYRALDSACYEAVRIDDTTENAITFGTGERCLCPHCGVLIKHIFDEAYTEGEHYEMSCGECEAQFTVLVESVHALLNISLDEDGVCQKCFHWSHSSGQCEPYSVKCNCQENDG